MADRHAETLPIHVSAQGTYRVWTVELCVSFYLPPVIARTSFAEMWRKKMEAMKDSDKTRTMKGSLEGDGFNKLRNIDIGNSHPETWRIIGVEFQHRV